MTDLSFALDDHGNVRGGVRTPYVDVPAATYYSDGKMVPFDKELLKRLYPSHEHYVNEVVRHTDVLLGERWIIPADAEAIKEQARQARCSFILT